MKQNKTFKKVTRTLKTLLLVAFRFILRESFFGKRNIDVFKFNKNIVVSFKKQFDQGRSSLRRQMWSATHWIFIKIPGGYNFTAKPINYHSSFLHTWDDVSEKYSMLQLNHSSFSGFEYSHLFSKNRQQQLQAKINFYFLQNLLRSLT